MSTTTPESAAAGARVPLPSRRTVAAARRSGPARRSPSWWRDAVGAATWAGLVVVVSLWLADAQVQELSRDSTAALASLGRLTGLVSAYLLLVQVLLMARIPMVERAYGQDVLARRHRLIGFTSLNLLVVHVVLITVGYTGIDSANVVIEFVDLVLDYPAMLLALAGTALLLMIAVTSLRRARARRRYESWHLLHLYAYLGAGLALPHQLWTGEEFLLHPWATVYWWTLWAAAVASVLVWRVGLPLYRTLRHRLRVVAVVQESPDVVSIWMRGRRLERLPVAAGQFFTWRFLGRTGWTRGHPFSLSAPPRDGHVRITVKDLGEGSRSLTRLRPGTRVMIEGPYGRLHGGTRTARKVTLLAGGIGVTPLRAMLEEMPQRPGDVTFVYRARDEADLVFRAELEQLAEHLGARVFFATGPRVPGRDSWLPASAGHLDDARALQQLVPDIARNDVYICGADGWMAAAHRAARAAGVPERHIHEERFTW
ncbi:ferric reductase-like transmembrane domain-containing protein [Spongisporangium articulatum]|uniref:Ferric reductase-like transmembrane domain-containing protein n=1 Tax=Spongisporangium articulatum TaxID=3362603 RepID=A0ABW8ALH5_9ACTN